MTIVNSFEGMIFSDAGIKWFVVEALVLTCS